jgi:signal transduction histidine kinase/ligand-binding sensor domain-containing protein
LKKIAWLLLGALGAWTLPLLGAPALSQREELSAALLRAERDPNSEFMLNVWQTGDGLPVNVIQELQQTPDGYLWLGTHQGLVRFDGVHFQSFFTTPTGLRYGARVGPLEVDPHGRLWLVPDQVGFVYRKAAEFTEVLTNETVLRARAVSLCSDGRQHMLWVDELGGLGRFSIEQPDQAERIAGRGQPASRWLRDFQGKLWLANSRGLKWYNAGKLVNVDLPGGALMAVAPRRRGGLWVANQGWLRYLEENGHFQDLVSFPWIGSGTHATCLLEDSHGRLWIGTSSQGLFCYAAGQFKQVVPAASTILSLLEDKEDNLWVGTRGAGLIRLRERHFFVHDRRSGLENEYVRSLAQDQAGRIWMVWGEGGLGWWQQGAWHPLGRAQGWLGIEALCVCPANDGGVWVATARRDLWRYAQGQFTRQKLDSRPFKEPVVDMLEDKHGRLWMVTDNSGIFCLEGNSITNYTEREGLPSLLIRRLVQDEAGNLWAGDWQGGIARFQGEHWEVVRSPSSHSDAVRCMAFSDGALWVGTSAGGLLRLKDGQTARASTEEGLPSACIQQLLSDGHGSLWGGTPHKLFQLSIPQLNAVMDGRESAVRAATFGRGDGLPETSFAFWSDPRCWHATNDELWFATDSGAIHFQPLNLPQSKPPQPVLEETLLDGKPVPAAALQHLRPGLGRLEFRFTAPCLTAPERIHFRYRLTGVDQDWVDSGTTRTATYASIPAGEHEFRVAASSPEGIWGSHVATLALSVHPYFWQTSWFQAAVAAFTAGGAVWLARRATVRRLRRRLERLRHEQAVERERTRIAQDIHDDLGANLTSIGLLADMGSRHKADPAALTRDLSQISQTARESVAAMDAIVWALNPRNDSLDHFANYVAQFTRDFFRPTTLRTRLELPPNLPTCAMTTEVRHQLFLLVKEAFNNVVRHAQATEVRLELACEEGLLRMTIADDGKGLSGPLPGEGQDGLTNLRERIERLGGTLCMESKVGGGTRLDFALPLDKLSSN